MSSHRNSNREGKKSVFHHFLSWPPSIAHPVPLYNAVHRPSWFLSVGSWRLHFKYYIKRGKKHKKEEKTFKVNIKFLIIRSSHKNSNRKETKSVFHHFCRGLPVSLTLCLTR